MWCVTGYPHYQCVTGDPHYQLETSKIKNKVTYLLWRRGLFSGGHFERGELCEVWNRGYTGSGTAGKFEKVRKR